MLNFPASFMYVLTPNATSVAVLSLDAPGQAKNVGSFDLAGPAKAAGLTISKYRVSSLNFIERQH